jgi:hypothetical protein
MCIARSSSTSVLKSHVCNSQMAQVLSHECF